MNASAFRTSSALMVAGLLLLPGTGCSSKPPAYKGFLSNYAKLQKQGEVMRYTSPRMAEYETFILDPVQVKEVGKLSPSQKAEVAQYFNTVLGQELVKRGYRVTTRPGDGVARVRVAVTDVQESKWYLNLHPGTKLTGAGTGGASMEGEVVDSVTAEQLAAVVQAGRGSQFELDTFSKLDDVKDTIKKWAENAVNRLDELRSKRSTVARANGA